MPFSDKLDRKQFVITSEVQVSTESDTDSILGGLKRIKGRIDGIIVSETEIEGVACDSVPVCNSLKEGGYNPLFETTTREKNRIELQNQLLRAADAGITNLLTFTRDYRITGDSLNEMMFFHVDSGKLFSVLGSLKEGVDVKGKELEGPHDFLVGAGIDAGWGRKVPDLELKEIEHMVEMGTRFFITTPVFDLNDFSQFYDRVKQFGVPVIPPPRSCYRRAGGRMTDRRGSASPCRRKSAMRSSETGCAAVCGKSCELPGQAGYEPDTIMC